MITVGNPFQEKNPTLQTRTIYSQILKITIHLQCKFLQEHVTITQTQTWTQRDSFEHLVLRTPLNYSNTSPSPHFIVIYNLKIIFGLTKPWAKTMGKTTMPHVIHLSFVTPKIAISSIIVSSSLDPHKIHILSCLYSKNSHPIFYQGQDTFLTTHTPFSNS